MNNSTLNLENPRAPKPLRPGSHPGSAQGASAAAREEELQRVEGMKIAQSAVQGIGMSTKEIRGTGLNNPNYALAVSVLFTRATNQRIMLGTEPSHVLSTSLLYNSLLLDSRFMQVPVSRAAPGDIVVQSGSLPDGDAGIVVDHGRIVSDSGNGVRNNSSLVELQRRLPPTLLFRYIGVQKYPGYTLAILANSGFNPDEPRLPAGQPGGGQWTDGLTSLLLGKQDTGNDSLTQRLMSGMDTAIGRGQNLPLDPTYEDNGHGHKKGIYITHYGPGKDVGGWDPYQDKNTNLGIGKRNNKLNHDSLAISKDVAKKAGLKPGDPVYINGQYLGNYDDTAPEDGRIDIYDPLNVVRNARWGGMLRGAKVTNYPY
jgi:hypothetical protein